MVLYQEKTKTFEFIFVVLVYRNVGDLRDFFEHFTMPRSKVIVVNSYYDDSSELEFRTIAETNHADYLSVPNNGYGTGNNRGIEYALKEYQFRYLVISNADITIESLCMDSVIPHAINAPNIITITGKKQNPHTPFYLRFLEKIKYYGFSTNRYPVVLLGCALNKILRECFYVMNKINGYNRIHAPHGAFLILPYDELKKMAPLFNEQMFLFAEEDHLAMLAKTNHVEVRYNPKIIVHHKEDGSVQYTPDSSLLAISRSSYLAYCSYWNVCN